MNKVFLIGRLTKDPDIKFTPGNGTAVCSISLAVDKYNTATKQREADFVPLVFWGKQAEILANYQRKGNKISIIGKIQTRTYDAKDGTKRFVTEVIVQELEFLDKKDSNSASNNADNSANNFGAGFGGDEDMTPVDDGDIPF